MCAYKLTNKKGEKINNQEFETYLESVFQKYRSGDTKKNNGGIVKAYRIYEKNLLLGLINVSYEPDKTSVMISETKTNNLVKKITENSNFKWDEE